MKEFLIKTSLISKKIISNLVESEQKHYPESHLKSIEKSKKGLLLKIFNLQIKWKNLNLQKSKANSQIIRFL